MLKPQPTKYGTRGRTRAPHAAEQQLRQRLDGEGERERGHAVEQQVAHAYARTRAPHAVEQLAASARACTCSACGRAAASETSRPRASARSRRRTRRVVHVRARRRKRVARRITTTSTGARTRGACSVARWRSNLEAQARACSQRSLLACQLNTALRGVKSQKVTFCDF